MHHETGLLATIAVGLALAFIFGFAALDRHSLPYVVVESDRQVIEKLRERNVPAVYGDAARPGILEHAETATARVLIVTAPEPLHARQVIDLARPINPEIDTVVRTHTSADQACLERLGVGLVVMGERELAFGMTRYALRGLDSRQSRRR
jgi:K+:H+ antiporter